MSLTRLKRTNELGHVFPTDDLLLLTPVSSQEIDEMLSNQLTLDDEDAVQAELRQLQGEAAEPVSQNRIIRPIWISNTVNSSSR
jgi:hypothetical protein